MITDHRVTYVADGARIGRIARRPERDDGAGNRSGLDALAHAELATGPTRPLEHRLTSDDRVAFLHLPKTAGTTLKHALENHFPRRRIFPYYSLADMQRVTPGMCDGYTYIRGHYKYDVLCTLLGRAPVCITMLRDPIERFISQYSHWERQRLGGDELGFDVFPFDSLAAYVACDEVVIATQNLDTQTRFIGDDSDFGRYDAMMTDLPAVRSAYRHVTQMPIGHGPEMLDRARRRLDAFAVVGIAECFQESLFLLCYTFGWRPILDANRLNVAPQRLQRAQLDATTLERVLSFNTLDQELYAHATRLFAARYAQMTEQLLQRYAPDDAASQARPLSHAAMYALLEQHYERQFAASYRPVHHLLIDFDDFLPGHGWYPAEFFPEHGTVRWTGPETTSTLDLPLATDRDLAIRFRVTWAWAPDVLASLVLTVNDWPVALTATRDEDGATIFTGRIPQTALASDAPFARLAFSVCRTITEDVPGDPRRLGLLFNWIEITPR